MKIIFLHGGSVNEFGPFESGEEIDLPGPLALDLIANGLAQPIAPISARPITIRLLETFDV